MGAAETTLTEPNLTRLYGTTMKRIVFDHDGYKVETLTPVFEPAF
jgi:hypothetical protein